MVKTPADGDSNDVKIAVPFKYLSSFRRTLEMPLINSKINIDLSCSEDCVISSATGETKYAVTDTKLYNLVVTLSREDNIKLVKQVESGFKRKFNWNKYQSKVSMKRQMQYIDYLIDPSFQGVNILSLSFQNKDSRKAHTEYFLPEVEINYQNFDVQ